VVRGNSGGGLLPLLLGGLGEYPCCDIQWHIEPWLKCDLAIEEMMILV
jgi:hypothetical protein